MTLELFLRLIAGVFLLFSNGFFVTTEFALTRVRQFDKEEFQGHKGLEIAWEMTEELEIYLSGCQVGITISSVALGIVAEPAVTELLVPIFKSIGITSGHGAISVLVSVGIINILHVVIGEQAPTYLGVERTKTISRYLVPILYAWVKLLYPIIILSDKITKTLLRLIGVEVTRSWAEAEEISDFVETRKQITKALEGSEIPADRREEILNAIDISRIPVKDIMIESPNIVSFRTTDSLEDILDKVEDNPHSRYPVIDSNGNYIGLVYTSSLFQNISDLQEETLSLEDIIVDVPALHPDTPVSMVIDMFQERQQELAVITQNKANPTDKNVIGIVTSTDAVEQITGEMADPFDEDTSGNN